MTAFVSFCNKYTFEQVEYADFALLIKWISGGANFLNTVEPKRFAETLE